MDESFKESQIDRHNELGTEHRLLYRWPIWFTDEATGVYMQVQMVDICSEAATFIFYPCEISLIPSQQITAHFSVPIYGLGDSFAVRNFTRAGYAYRIDRIKKVLHRVATKFSEPLPFRPGEQACNEASMITLFKILSSVNSS